MFNMISVVVLNNTECCHYQALLQMRIAQDRAKQTRRITIAFHRLFRLSEVSTLLLQPGKLMRVQSTAPPQP